jgi:hypothetical protein
VIEHARADLDNTAKQRDELAGQLGANAGEVETRLGQLETETSGKRQARDEIAKRVPVVLFRRYEMIRARRGTALCYTTNGTCSACYIALSPMTFQVLRRGMNFDQCPSCNRILYFRAEATEGADPTAASAPVETPAAAGESAESANES